MKKYIVCLFVALAPMVAPTATAGPFADDMSRCMVRATTAEDRAMLVQWIFAVIALHPDVSKLSAVPAAKRDELNKSMGDLTVALLTDRCAKESREALKNEGMGTIESSFGVLGQAAMQEVFKNTDVAAGVAAFSKHLDEKKIMSLVESAK